MTAPDSFQPEAVHAVTAQQEEITELRAELGRTRDRNVYLRACMIQMQVEARTEIGRLQAEISMLKTELTNASGDGPAVEEHDKEG